MATSGRTGVVRIRADLWERINHLCVQITIKTGAPVNQSTIIHAMLLEMLDDLKEKEIIEILYSEIEEAEGLRMQARYG